MHGGENEARVSVTRSLAGRRPSARLVMIERLRLLAMFEIVAFHAFGRVPVIAGLGLPTFLLLTVAFSAIGAERRGARAVATTKLFGLGAAWLFWCVPYAGLLFWVAHRHGASLLAQLTPTMPLYGTSIHLWFAPFAIVTGTLAALAAPRDERRRAANVAFAIVGVALLFVLPSGHAFAPPAPIPQWMFGAPALFLGLALASIFRVANERPRLLHAALGLSLVLATVSIVRLDAEASMRRYAVSFAGILLSLSLSRLERQTTWDRVTPHLTPLLLGVYFVHPLVGYVLAPRLHELGGAFSALVFVVSLGVVAGMRRTRLARFVSADAMPRGGARIPRPATEMAPTLVSTDADADVRAA